jgi:hypothetical protein
VHRRGVDGIATGVGPGAGRWVALQVAQVLVHELDAALVGRTARDGA